jgi:aldose 1-epimerase
MRFEAGAERVDGVDTFCLWDTVTGAACHLLPGLGGTVWRLSLAAAEPGQPAGAGGSAAAAIPATVLEADTPAELAVNPWFRGRLLLPFNDRIPGGIYRFAGREHRLAVNDPQAGDAIHGLVYDRPFSLEEARGEEEAAEARLSAAIGPDDFAGYPFSLWVSVTYRLSTAGFELALAVRNTGAEPAPVAMGWHPYIAAGGVAAGGVAAPPAGSIDGLRLTCPAPRFVEVDEELLPTGRRPAVTGGPLDFTSPRRIGSQELDIGLERAPGIRPAGDGDPGAVGAATTVVDRGVDRIIVEQTTDPFGFTQLFIPPSRTSIAVEPVTAATDAFNRPELGLRRLESGAALRGTVRIRRSV